MTCSVSEVERWYSFCYSGGIVDHHCLMSRHNSLMVSNSEISKPTKT